MAGKGTEGHKDSEEWKVMTDEWKSRNRLLLGTVAVLTFLFLSSCGSSFKAVKPDASTGHFSQGAVSPEDIKVSKPLAGITGYELLYLRTYFTFRDREYDLFVREMFDNMGIFRKIVNRTEMEQFVIKSGLSGAVSGVNDAVSLHRLSRVIGKFLVADAVLQKTMAGSGSYTFTITILNPTNGETVFSATKRAFNLSGLDEPLLYPVFNALSDWVKASKELTPEEEKGVGPKTGI